MSFKVGIVEDEPIVAAFVEQIATKKGHTVVFSTDCDIEALKLIREKAAELIFLDINLKGKKEGIALAQKIATDPTLSGKIAIIYITAYSDNDTLMQASKTKPCNFIAKPFGEKELEIALALATQKRLQKENIQFSAGYSYSFQEKKLVKDGVTIKLTNNERKLLETLLKSSNHLVSNEQLLYEVWEEKLVTESTLRDTVYRLRKKIPDIELENIAKIGYVLKM